MPFWLASIIRRLSLTVGKMVAIAHLRKLDHRMIICPKVMFFFIASLYYSFYVYRMDFYTTHLGFSESQGGIIHFVWNIASFAGAMFWSSTADAHLIHKKLLLGISLSLGVVFQAVRLKSIVHEEYSLWLAMAVFGLYGLLTSAIMPLTDYQILKLLKGKYKAPENLYGRQVMFGTIANGLITAFTSRLIKAYGFEVLFWVIPIASILAGMIIASFGASDYIIDSTMDVKQDDDGGDEVKVPEVKGIVESIRAMKSPCFLLFLLIILSVGIGRQMLTLYLYHYMTKELQLTGSEVGDAYLANSLFSILILFSGPSVLKYLGVRPMLIVGQAALIVRLAFYSYLKPGRASPWQVMFVELLNGVSFSFTHLAGVREAAASSPPGFQAAFQAAYTSAYTHIPAILCSIIGGYLIPLYGGRAVMMGTTVVLAIALVLNLLLAIFTKGPSCQGKLMKDGAAITE